MKALIVGAAPVLGSDVLVRELAAECDLVVAADAAAEWCIAAGVAPDIAVGDFDSALPGAVERLSQAHVDVRRFSAEKNKSDLDLAVDAARAAGATELVLSACTSARLDHTLGTVGTAAANADLHPVIREPHLNAWVIASGLHGCTRLALPPRTTVSVFALGEARGVTLGGFRYALNRATLGSLSSQGLSNVSVEDEATVSVESGTLLVITSRDT